MNVLLWGLALALWLAASYYFLITPFVIKHVTQANGQAFMILVIRIIATLVLVGLGIWVAPL